MEGQGEPAQAAAFIAAVLRNDAILRLLDRLRALDLPGSCVAGGCLFQSVWNDLHGFAPRHGIGDYDVFYFDPLDRSEQAEASVARRVREAVADLAIDIDVRNQARVHLWYEAEYGAASPPFRSSEEGIDHFLAPCCGFGLHRDDAGLVPYAPFGYADLFTLTVRPNPRRADSGGAALRAAYDCKTRRWRQVWPRLSILPW